MSLTSGVKLFVHLLNVVVRFFVFLTSATLIFRGKDITVRYNTVLDITRFKDGSQKSIVYIEK